MSGIALEPVGVGDDICLPVTVGRGPEASLLRGLKWNLPGASAVASLEDRRLKRLKVGDFRDEDWAADCEDVDILR